jgi:excisionase family DNA binding protein
MKPDCSDPMPEDAITPTQAAKICNASLNSVWRWIRQGRVRAWRIGELGRLHLSEAEVRGMMRQVVIPKRLPPRDKNGERLTAELDRQREARARKLLRLPPLEDNGAA